MNSQLCKFSILRYVPSENREEFINIGLVFHCPEDAVVQFRQTSNFSRVTAFDDEMDIEFLKLVLDGVKEEFTQSTTHGPSLKSLKDEMFLERTTSFYANQLQFSPIKVIRSSDLVKDFENLFRTYVYFDSKKKDRISEAKVKTIMNRVLRANVNAKKMERDYSVNVGTEDVVLDYAYKSKKNHHTKYIKTLSFDYSSKRTKQATATAKEWAWNYSKIQEISQRTNNNINIQNDLLTVVYVNNRDKHINTALKILEEHSSIFSAGSEDRIKDFADNIIQDIE